MYKTSLRPLNPSDVPEVEKLLENNTTLPNQLREKVCLSSFENREENKSFNHIQTYREYKEALKQQRLSDGLSAYKSREQVIFSENSNSNDKVNLKNMSMSTIRSKQIFCGGTTDKRPVQKVTPSIVNQDTLFSNNSNNTSNHKNFNQYGRTSTQSNSPIKTKSDHLFEIINPERSSNFSKTAVLSNEGNADSNQMCRPRSPQNITWNVNSSENYSFTMRREYERAKEEADLIQQLRRHIETRLKMTLPNELAPALADGVVLCHLANYVRPHSVASIHVPSPAVPKLTMARCRRNVDNFLEACRKIGVDEEVLLDADAIMDVGYIGTFGLASLHRLVSTLIFYAEEYFQESETCSVNTIQDHILSTVLAAVFVSFSILFYMFPLPN
ncbi:leucine-rich repeat and calponin homology domain-containing protein 2-like [Copidosoma floridanum]|uniref:leucine-rich repeat and calponin homology domain-containing protein 2-like n=1 Tax=Copidosoma floridanum TaxID=29053 RepID=UPI0006C99C23|nr:leucine-rich repeat and calponin homology domain-containing protein 2-like [Copidosoma floridanum]